MADEDFSNLLEWARQVVDYKIESDQLRISPYAILESFKTLNPAEQSDIILELSRHARSIERKTGVNVPWEDIFALAVIESTRNPNNSADNIGKNALSWVSNVMNSEQFKKVVEDHANKIMDNQTEDLIRSADKVGRA